MPALNSSASDFFPGAPLCPSRCSQVRTAAFQSRIELSPIIQPFAV